MGDIIVAALAILLYIDSWWTIRNHIKDIDDLSTRYFILKDKTRDLENRIRLLETHKKKKKKSYKVYQKILMTKLFFTKKKNKIQRKGSLK